MGSSEANGQLSKLLMRSHGFTHCSCLIYDSERMRRRGDDFVVDLAEAACSFIFFKSDATVFQLFNNSLNSRY